jgi:phage terminase large subunit-like protein
MGTVGRRVEELMLRYRVQNIGVDKFAASTMMQEWQRMGWPVIDFPMYDSSICPASVTMYDRVRRGLIAHTGDPQLREHVLNAIMSDRGKDRWRFDKPKDPARKIDGMIASIIAVQLLAGAQPNHLETHGIYF